MSEAVIGRFGDWAIREMSRSVGYVNSEREDLTPQQIKKLSELIKEMKDG